MEASKKINPNMLIPVIKTSDYLENSFAPKMSKKTALIPTPLSKTSAISANRKPYTIPDYYIKYVANTGSMLPTAMDFYDTPKEDVLWVGVLNERNPLLDLKLEQVKKLVQSFEHIIFLRSRVLGENVKLLSLSEARKIGYIFQIKKEVVSLVYDYWVTNRKKTHKPFIRKYSKKTPQDDPSLFKSFRPRVVTRRTSTRTSNRGRNDKGIMEKLKIIKKDLKSFIKLVHLVRKREEKKREQVIYDALIFDKCFSLTRLGKEFIKRKDEKGFKKYKNKTRSYLPYDQYFKFNNRFRSKQQNETKLEITMGDVYGSVLKERTSEKFSKMAASFEINHTENSEFERKHEESERKKKVCSLVREKGKTSVVFSVDPNGELCFDVFYESLFGENSFLDSNSRSYE